MDVAVTKENGIIVCDVSGDFDMYEAPAFHARYGELVRDNAADHIVIDLAKTPYIDSSGIGVLFQIFSDTRSRGVGFCICNAGGMIEKLFKLSRMAEIFPLEKSRESAIARVRR